MPYEVKKRGSKWVVQKEGGGKVFGKHDTLYEARQQQKAIYASEGKKKGKHG